MATKRETESKQQQTTPEEKSHRGNGSKDNPGNGQSEFDLKQEIDELLQSLSGELNDIESDDALNLVNHWYDFLRKAKEPDVKELANGLKELQKLLKSDKATGHEISEVLIHIGEQTSEVSDTAEKGFKQPIQRLGKQLRKAGTSIAKAEDQEYLHQIDELVEKTDGENLTSVESEDAVQAIDFWQNVLNKADGEKFKQLATSLKDLKQVLKRGNAKPQTVAKALSQVGEQTTELASEAPRGFKGAVQKLGKQLSHVGSSLTADE